MRQKPYLRITATIFGVIALMHLLRVVFGIPIQVGEGLFPVALSWLGIVGGALLSIWGFRLAGAGGR